VREVEDDLVVGVAVDGGHDAAHDTAVSQQTFTTGARQLVVQLAFEITLCLKRRTCRRSRRGTNGQIFVGGRSRDETFLTVETQVRLGLVASVKWPVDSTPISADRSPIQLGGSRSAHT